VCKPIRAEVSPGSKRTLDSYHETHKGARPSSHPGSGQKPRRLYMGTCMVSTNTCTNINIVYTITRIRTQDTAHDTGTRIQLSINTQDHIHKYITNPNTVHARRCKEKHSPITQSPKLHAPEFPSEEIQNERRKGGLAPWWPPALG